MSKTTKFIFLDTNIWICLASEPNYSEQLNKMKEIINYPDFSLVLPESVKVEFNRHRDSIVKKWQQRFKSQATDSYKLFKMLLPGREPEIQNLFQEAQNCIDNGIEQVQTNLGFIDELFNLAEVAQTSHLMSEAAQRCLHHLPPASKSARSSVGDCLLWLVALDYLERGEVWFCTDNKGDFSEQKRQDLLNTELQGEADSKNFSITYFIDTNKLIEAALPYKPELPDYINFFIVPQSMELAVELARSMRSLSDLKISDLTNNLIAAELASELVRRMEGLASITTKELAASLIAPELASESLKKIRESLALKPEIVQTIAEQLKKGSSIVAPDLASNLAKAMGNLPSIKATELAVNIVAPELAAESLKKMRESLALKPTGKTDNSSQDNTDSSSSQQ